MTDSLLDKFWAVASDGLSDDCVAVPMHEIETIIRQHAAARDDAVAILRRIAAYPDANPISDAHYLVRKWAKDFLSSLGDSSPGNDEAIAAGDTASVSMGAPTPFPTTDNKVEKCDYCERINARVCYAQHREQSTPPKRESGDLPKLAKALSDAAHAVITFSDWASDGETVSAKQTRHKEYVEVLKEFENASTALDAVL